MVSLAMVIVAFGAGVALSDKVKAGLAKLKGDVTADVKAEVQNLKDKV